MSVLIIAEAGVNHDGSVDDAKRMVRAAKLAGADVVKFQAFRATELACNDAPKADYQERTTGTDESQQAMLARLELSRAQLADVRECCRSEGIRFLASPFDLESLETLLALDVDTLKLGSGELTNAPLLVAAGKSELPLIVSTGMATLSEIAEALGALGCPQTPSRAAFRAEWPRDRLKDRVTLLHCVTEYPAPPQDINLRAMATIARTFGLPVGYSDHALGIGVSLAAVALGATVIEKHFTLDRRRPGPDHGASLEPDELATLVTEIRRVESALGSDVKAPAPSEIKNIAIARRSVVAARPITRGEHFSAENLTTKRPATGTSAMDYYDLIGQTATRDYGADEKVP